MFRHLLFSWLVLFGLASGVGCSGEKLNTVVADFDFQQMEVRPWYCHYGPHAWWHWFEPEWIYANENGAWGTGRNLAINLYLPGRDCQDKSWGSS